MKKKRSIKGIVFSVVFTMTVLSATPVMAGTPATPKAVATTNTMVWQSATSKCYHSKNTCGKMNPKKAKQITLDQAKAKGLKKCSKCW